MIKILTGNALPIAITLLLQHEPKFEIKCMTFLNGPIRSDHERNICRNSKFEIADLDHVILAANKSILSKILRRAGIGARSDDSQAAKPNPQTKLKRMYEIATTME